MSCAGNYNARLNLRIPVRLLLLQQRLRPVLPGPPGILQVLAAGGGFFVSHNLTPDPLHLHHTESATGPRNTPLLPETPMSPIPVPSLKADLAQQLPPSLPGWPRFSHHDLVRQLSQTPVAELGAVVEATVEEAPARSGAILLHHAYKWVLAPQLQRTVARRGYH